MDSSPGHRPVFQLEYPLEKRDAIRDADIRRQLGVFDAQLSPRYFSGTTQRQRHVWLPRTQSEGKRLRLSWEHLEERDMNCPAWESYFTRHQSLSRGRRRSRSEGVDLKWINQPWLGYPSSPRFERLSWHDISTPRSKNHVMPNQAVLLAEARKLRERLSHAERAAALETEAKLEEVRELRERLQAERAAAKENEAVLRSQLEASQRENNNLSQMLLVRDKDLDQYRVELDSMLYELRNLKRQVGVAVMKQ